MDSKKLISSQWSDCFPAGLRVLVLDADPTHLKVLENMLNKCNYQVTTCNLMREALDLLQNRKDGFDIVMSNVSISDMDAFELLKHVRLKMNIPVIMMSVDGETSTVMKGVQHGACDYLMKPIRMEELQNIWQHVVRKRIHESRDIQVKEKPAPQMMRNPGTNIIISSEKKRKDVDTRRNHDRESSRGSSVKKARVVWTTDLHHKFVKSVDQIGIDKVGPKKILDLMGVPWLTRENVASHLQKYRLYLRRLQEENEVKVASARIKKLSCTSSTDPAAKNVSLQSSVRQTSVTVRQNLVTNGKYFIPQHKIQIHNSTYKGNTKGILSVPMSTKHTDALFGVATYLPISSTTTTTSRVSLNNHFVGPHFESKGHQLDHHQQNNYVSHYPAPPPPPPSTEGYDATGKVIVAENNRDALVSLWSTRNQNITTQNVVYDHLDSSMRNLIVGESPQGDLYPLNQDGLGSFGCSINQELIIDVPRHMYDLVNSDCGYYSDDSLECLINQGLYIS
ncbi:hypothetical protein OROHE_003474 [Orobanche hederae]